MNAFTKIEPHDPIRTFMPGISDDEYQHRAKLQTMKNCAAAMIAKTESDTARSLAWTCSEYATAYIFAGADNNQLSEVGRFCHRLIITAMQAEGIDDGGAA